ncbi:hypothetical protein [Neisseria sp.]|uniref:hypothetical protein n=1 Tax=Neisseria sp. TaxID=192066 RepID=UPI0026DB1408|nr:hypothetical protein [Neisseria sp.]MDO4907985.1 hypothetical protein [Neisseria sp.]
MNNFIKASLLLFPAAHLGIGLLVGFYHWDQPLKTFVGLAINTVIYVVPMYLLLKSRKR